MNESNSEVLVKKNIVMYAKKIRDIQQEQVNPYMELIEKNLAELYPSLVDRDDVLKIGHVTLLMHLQMQK
jgi:hypothetical protein